MEILPEPIWQITLVNVGLPYFGYFLGLLFLHLAFHGAGRPSFAQRWAIGLPVGLIICSSFLGVLGEIEQPSWGSLLFITGFAMEQGVLVDLAITHYIRTMGGPPDRQTPLAILEERYARGEIDREEFEQKKQDLT